MAWFVGKIGSNARRAGVSSISSVKLMTGDIDGALELKRVGQSEGQSVLHLARNDHEIVIDRNRNLLGIVQDIVGIQPNRPLHLVSENFPRVVHERIRGDQRWSVDGASNVLDGDAK